MEASFATNKLHQNTDFHKRNPTVSVGIRPFVGCGFVVFIGFLLFNYLVLPYYTLNQIEPALNAPTPFTTLGSTVCGWSISFMFLC